MEGIPTLPNYFELQARALTPANPLKDKKCLFPNSTLQFPRIFFFAKRNSSSVKAPAACSRANFNSSSEILKPRLLAGFGVDALLCTRPLPAHSEHPPEEFGPPRRITRPEPPQLEQVAIY